MNRPRSADSGPQEATSPPGRSCGLKPALLTGSGSPGAPVLPASRLPMTWLIQLMAAAWLFATLPLAQAAPDKIIKVLPHYLDLKGKHALSPSLFERDAYQAMLRRNPALRSGLQFDIHWKARKSPGRTLQLRLELVTTERPKGDPFTVDLTVDPTGKFSRWKRVKFEKALADQLGEIVAWRLSLREGDKVLSEQRSFLW